MREQLAFELERFAWVEDGCLELGGHWRGLGGGRIARPQLVLRTDEGDVRAPAVRHDRRPGADGSWSAAFRVPPGVGEVGGAELDLGRNLILTLPPPDPPAGAPPVAPVSGRGTRGLTGEPAGAPAPGDRLRGTGPVGIGDRGARTEGLGSGEAPFAGELARLRADNARLANEVKALRAASERLTAEVEAPGVDPDGPTPEVQQLRADNERLSRGLDQLVPDSQKLARDTERLLADNERLAREAQQAELARAQTEQAWGAARVEAQAARTADRQAAERRIAAEREAAADAREALEAEVQALAAARDRALEAAEGSRLQAAERETELERERQRAGPVREELELLRGTVARGEAELARLRSEVEAMRAGSEPGSGGGPVGAPGDDPGAAEAERGGEGGPTGAVRAGAGIAGPHPGSDAAQTARLPVAPDDDGEDAGDRAGGPPQTVAGDRTSTARMAPWAPAARPPGPGASPRHLADDRARAGDDPTEDDAAHPGRRPEPLWNGADSRRRRSADHASGAAPLPPVPRHADVYEPRPRWPLRVLVLGSAGLLLLALYLLIDGMA